MALIEAVELKNTKTGENISLSKDKMDWILEYVEIESVEARISQHELVGQDGVYISNVAYMPRQISIVGWLVGDTDTEISEMRSILNKNINPKHVIEILINGYKIEGTPQKSIAYGSDVEVMNEVMCRFAIDFLCPQPLFTTEAEVIASVANWDKMLTFPLEFNLPNNTMVFGSRKQSLIVDIDNKGHVDAGLKLEILSKSDVYKPRVTNISTQEYIEIDIQMRAGDRILIDTTKPVKTATLFSNGSETNVINEVTSGSTYLMLPMGINSFSYSSQTNPESLEVFIHYPPLFLEVR